MDGGQEKASMVVKKKVRVSPGYYVTTLIASGKQTAGCLVR